MLDHRYWFPGAFLIVLPTNKIVEAWFAVWLFRDLTFLEDLAILNCLDIIQLLRGFILFDVNVFWLVCGF